MSNAAIMNDSLQITLINGRTITSDDSKMIHRYKSNNIFEVDHYHGFIKLTIIKIKDINDIKHTMLLLGRKLYYFIEIPLNVLYNMRQDLTIHPLFKENFPHLFLNECK